MTPAFVARCARSLRVAVVVGVVGSIIGALGWFVLEMWERHAYGVRPDNRFAIYEVRRSLAPGMSVRELEDVLVRAEARGARRRWNRERTRVSVWTRLSLVRTCYLLIDVQQGKVAHAVVRGEDGQRRFPDAPPDF
jgi:hypothetical protein